MKIIHQIQTAHHAGVFSKVTKCGINSITGIRGTYTLGDALKKLDYSVNSVLCAGCFHWEVGQIKFDTEPSYGKELQTVMTHPGNEIIDAEEL